MEFYMIILCGILVGFGVYLMLSKSMMRIIIGVGLFGHAANLIILIAGGLYDGDIPIISELGKKLYRPNSSSTYSYCYRYWFCSNLFINFNLYR